MGSFRDIALVPVTHDLDVSTAPELRAYLDTLIDGGCLRVVLDMTECDYVDSVGMSLLMGELRRMRSAGGVISLTNVSKRVYRMLQVLRLVDFMPVSRAGERPDVPDLASGTMPLWCKTIHVDPERMGEARRWVVRLACLMHFSRDEVFDVELAVGEAIGNAVDHTCAEGIMATVLGYPDRMVVEVTDCGCGIELDAGEEPPESEGGEERGRGIKLMRLLADSVTITRRARGQGTQVRIVKMIPHERL